MTALRSVSFGAGVQSTALLVLAARREINFRLFLFANVGDDSEHPATLEYFRDVHVPYAAAHDLELVELRRIPQKGYAAGQVETLLGRITRPDGKSTAIPVRLSRGAPARRSCTADFKVAVLARELKRRGATADNPATVALGISVDEIQRAKPGIDPLNPEQDRTYPLLDLGLRREDCVRITAEAGLPPAPRSACWFCPYHSREEWRRLRRDEPDLFDRACTLEETMSAKQVALGNGPVWFTDAGRPLASAVADQLALDLDGTVDGCESGFCFT